MSSGFVTIILSIGMMLSLTLLILAGVLAKSWVPMVNLIGIMFIPVLIVTGDSCGGDSILGVTREYDETKQSWMNFSSCFAGTVVCSMVALPLILTHMNTITLDAMGYWIGSSAAMSISEFDLEKWRVFFAPL